MGNYNRIQQILMITTEFPPGPGGIGNHAWNLAKQLNSHLPTHVLAISDYADENQCLAFDNIEKLYIYRFKRFRISLITYCKRIFDIIKHFNNYHYTHCILSGKFALWMSIIIKILYKRNTKLIGVLHGSELLPSNRRYIFLLKRSLINLDAVISVSRFTDSLISDKIVDKSRRYIIANGVNIKQFNINDIVMNKKDLIGEPCLLTVGSITNRKGQSNLINALPLILKYYPKAHYHCIGLPIEGDKLIKLAKRLKVNTHLTLHGFIANDKLGEMYQHADILIMLSQSKLKSDAEGFGIAILEANLFGVPAIGSIETGIEDAVQDNETGILVNPYLDEEILSAIDNILNNREKLSKNAIKWAKDHNWGKIFKEYLQVIENA